MQHRVPAIRIFYGPREIQKGKMASMVYQLYCQLRDHGTARLFESSGGYCDGEQRRDFVFVDDVVKVNMFFANGPTRKGIVNCGSGRSHSFNDIANALGSLATRRHLPPRKTVSGAAWNTGTPKRGVWLP